MSIESIGAIGSINGSDRLMPDFTSTTDGVGAKAFFDLLSEKTLSVDHALDKSNGLLVDYMKGKDVAVHDIMIAMGKAKTELQLIVEVRNKLLEAYQEVTRIQL